MCIWTYKGTVETLIPCWVLLVLVTRFSTQAKSSPKCTRVNPPQKQVDLKNNDSGPLLVGCSNVGIMEILDKDNMEGGGCKKPQTPLQRFTNCWKNKWKSTRGEYLEKRKQRIGKEKYLEIENKEQFWFLLDIDHHASDLVAVTTKAWP